MFAINDQAKPGLRSNLIKRIELPDGKKTGGKTDRMAEWLQHVYILGSKTEVTFDLMFIDIQFDKDENAPKYGDGIRNPLGLLHALTFASRQDPFGPPFVWGYHSGGAEMVMKDPIAIIAFSLLTAMEQRTFPSVNDRPWRWDGIGLHNAPEAAQKYFSDALGAIPKSLAEDIFKDMMVRYRAKLLDYIVEERIAIESDGIDQALQWATARSDDEALTKLAQIHVGLSSTWGPVWRRELLLQSLFADELVDIQQKWPKDHLTHVRNYLSDLNIASCNETRSYWIDQVDGLMARIKAKEKNVLKTIRPPKYKRRIGAMAVVCWWLERKADQARAEQRNIEQVSVNSNDLLSDFGYIPDLDDAREVSELSKKKRKPDNSNRGPLEGCAELLIGDKSLSGILDYLEDAKESLRAPYADVCMYWWTKRCDSSGLPVPRCLQAGS
jgi:hypothetical protein